MWCLLCRLELLLLCYHNVVFVFVCVLIVCLLRSGSRCLFLFVVVTLFMSLVVPRCAYVCLSLTFVSLVCVVFVVSYVDYILVFLFICMLKVLGLMLFVFSLGCCVCCLYVSLFLFFTFLWCCFSDGC